MRLQQPRRPESQAYVLNLDAQQCEHYLRGLMKPTDKRREDREGVSRRRWGVNHAPATKPLPPLPFKGDDDNSRHEKYPTPAQAYRPWAPLKGPTMRADVPRGTAYTDVRPDSAVLRDSISVYSSSGEPSMPTPSSPTGELPFSSRPPSLDPSTQKFCEVCARNVALSTGFCWQCEEMWTSVRESDFARSLNINIDIQPEPSPTWTDHVSSSSQYSVYSAHASSVYSARDSSGAGSPPGRLTSEPSGNDGLAQPTPLSRIPPLNVKTPRGYNEALVPPRLSPAPVSPKPLALDSFSRPGTIPKLLKERALLKPVQALDWGSLSPASKLLIPEPLRTGDAQRSPRSVVYDDLSYYFEGLHSAEFKEVKMDHPSRRLAKRCARQVKCGGAGWF